jgi:NADH-quinone oxidoreductase subunit H
MVYAFIPFGPHIWAANPDLSLIFMMAIFGVAPLGVFFAGWASNNKYTLIGGMRSAAQLTAYEIPLLITVLSIAVISGSFNILEIVDFQIETSNTWNIFILPLGAVLFLVTMIAEVERIPFDMPEAEAELVEGWWTEYGGIRWGLMFATEMMRAYAACILFAMFFLGGWEFPFEDFLSSLPFLGEIFEVIFTIIPGLVWVLLKAWLLFAFFVWIRASLHRIRTDQILEFGWLYLLPLSLVNLVIATFLRLEVWTDSGWPIWAAPVLTITALFFFVVYAIDEDEEALSQSRRPYSTQTLSKAYPGTQEK